MKKSFEYYLVAFFCFITVSINAQELKEGIRLSDNEQYDEATEYYKALISKDPSNALNYFYMGENYLRADNIDSAKIMFDQGIGKNPELALNYVGLGKLAMKEGNLSQAESQFAIALKKATDNKARVLGETAESYIIYEKKNLNKADSLLRQAISIEPKNPDWQILLGDVYTEMNNGSLAVTFYNTALDMDPKSVKSLVRKGKLYKRSQNYDGASAEFRNAIAIDPNFAPAHRELGEIYFLQRNMTDAKSEYKKYLELSKNNNAARLRYASFLFLGGEYEEGLKELATIQRTDSLSAPSLRLQAYLNHEAKNDSVALIAAEKLISRYDSTKKINATDYEYYGKILLANGKDSLALEALNKAIEMDPRKSELSTELGNAFMKMKKYAEAEQQYGKRIAEGGRGVTSADYFLYGRSAYYNKNYTLADSIFGKVNELQPTWPQGFLWRAQANTHIDSTSTLGLARPYYEKFLELALADSVNISKHRSGIMESYRYLGFYWFLQKDNQKSLEYWKKVLEMEPKDKQAQEAIKRIK
jgi:tetratricopeptide (TPR) repeat protein